MADLPTGTITFLFTDVEGSTRLWEEHPRAMRAVLARHDALLAGAFAAHDGVVVRPRGEGDSLFAVFVRATDAVAGALTGQRLLQAEDWGEIGPLRVRMGVHTGEADLREGDYYGSAVNRCARIRAAGHGGQVLLSQTTAHLIRARLPDGVSLRDLGQHGLKDLAQPERLFQVAAADLPDVFPPLKTLTDHPNNLPQQLTALIGRERELAEAGALLRGDAVRLVTLTGPGGAGKTRLALQCAADANDDFPDGVYVVALAPIRDPAHVAPAIARAIGASLTAGQSPIAAIAERLADRAVLLVLDNFEQVVDAAPLLADVLACCPRLKLLTTSRERLRLRGERHYPVPPLSLPDGDAARNVATIAGCEAVRLFVERAQAAEPGFALDASNAADVAAICRRLDGLPLAIELAAARVRLLTPAALRARLDRGLALLTGGDRDLPQRQQTLRDAIAWSYDLLSAPEQAMFRHFAVFAGGCALEAAEEVVGDRPPATDHALPAADVLDGLASLIEKSLLTRRDGHDGVARFVMLETIHEFAAEQLPADPRAEEVRRRHARFYRALVEDPSATAPPFATLTREHDNLRTALRYLIDSRAGMAALEMATGLCSFWLSRGHLAEGRAAVDAALLAAPNAPAAPRTRALRAAGRLANAQGAYAEAAAFLEKALTLARATHDDEHAVATLVLLGNVAHSRRQHAHAASLGEEALALARPANDVPGSVAALNLLGFLAQRRGDLAAAVAHCEEALALARTLSNAATSASLLNTLGTLARGQGDFRRAVALCEESLALARDLPDRANIGWALVNLAGARRSLGEREAAEQLLEESVALFDALGNRDGAHAALTSWRHSVLGRGETLLARRRFAERLAQAQRAGGALDVARTLNGLGEIALAAADYAAARDHLSAALVLARRLDSPEFTAQLLAGLGSAAAAQGDPAAAATALEESLTLCRAAGNAITTADVLGRRGEVALAAGNGRVARDQFKESLALYRRAGRWPDVARVLERLARAAWQARAYGQAAALARESLAVYRRLRHDAGMAAGLETLAAATQGRGQLERAVRLLGAAEALRERSHVPVLLPERGALDATIAAIRERLDPTTFAATWAAGRSGALDDVITGELAERGRGQAGGPSPARRAFPDGLTAREVEILRLVALGRTNREIGAELVISVFTVERHVNHILTKTGAANRTEAGAYAHRAGLLA